MSKFKKSKSNPKSKSNIKSKLKSKLKKSKSKSKSNLYYHIKVKLNLISQTGLTLTDKEFHRHLSKHLNDLNMEEIVYFCPVYHLRLLNKTLHFDIVKEEYEKCSYDEDKKEEIKRRIKMSSLADEAWESSDTNFWKIVKDEQELFLVGIDKVSVI
jgi:hypothetical protein